MQVRDAIPGAYVYGLIGVLGSGTRINRLNTCGYKKTFFQTPPTNTFEKIGKIELQFNALDHQIAQLL